MVKLTPNQNLTIGIMHQIFDVHAFTLTPKTLPVIYTAQ